MATSACRSYQRYIDFTERNHFLQSTFSQTFPYICSFLNYFYVKDVSKCEIKCQLIRGKYLSSLQTSFLFLILNGNSQNKVGNIGSFSLWGDREKLE